MAKVVKKPVLPIYAVGVVWLVFALFFSLHTLSNYIVCAVISALAFVVVSALCPAKTYEMPDAEKKKESAGEEKKTKSTGNKEIDDLIKERDMALSEMRRLNDAIEDEKISEQIDHLEEATRKIIDQVVAEPKKLPQIRKFMSYYLPTTLKILNAYDRMDSVGISGQNIDATKSKVEGMLDTIVTAFDKQLDSLFGAEALDISTDITVMENLLAQEGLAGMDINNTDKEDDGGITLQL